MGLMSPANTYGFYNGNPQRDAEVDRALDVDETLRRILGNSTITSLGSYVEAAFNEADEARRMNGVEEEMFRAIRARNCEYDPEDVPLLQGVDVYMGITELKCRALESWIRDILAQSHERPWTLSPTPEPEISEDMYRMAAFKLREELMTIGLPPGVSLADRATEMKQLLLRHATTVAAENTERMETRIHDHMIEGGWVKSFNALISDFATMPTVCLVGPVSSMTRKMKHDGDRVTAVNKQRLSMRRISPLDVYPAPHATDPQSGAYVIIRDRMEKHDLLAAGQMAGWDQQAIRMLIAHYPWGFDRQQASDPLRNLYNKMMGLKTQKVSCNYDVLRYYGRVDGAFLLEHGVIGVDHHNSYEAEVWTCGGIVIRAILNPHMLDRRPVYTSSFNPQPDSFWGKSLPSLLRSVQRVANSSARSLVRNMGYASGPIGEADVDRMKDESDISEVKPFRIYKVSSEFSVGSQGAAMRFHKVPSNAAELMAVYDRFSKEADDISGVPAYVLGNPAVAGAGRTLGGLSLLMGNAAKGVKQALGYLDRDIISEVVEAYYQHFMIYSDDRSIKADASVIARGASGLLQRELSQARAVEVLQLIIPFMQTPGPDGRPMVAVEGVQDLLRDIISGLGYKTDALVPDNARSRQVSDLLAGLSSQPGTPAPALDGRSAVPTDPAALEQITAVPSSQPLGMPQGA